MTPGRGRPSRERSPVFRGVVSTARRTHSRAQTTMAALNLAVRYGYFSADVAVGQTPRRTAQASSSTAGTWPGPAGGRTTAAPACAVVHGSSCSSRALARRYGVRALRARCGGAGRRALARPGGRDGRLLPGLPLLDRPPRGLPPPPCVPAACLQDAGLHPWSATADRSGCSRGRINGASPARAQVNNQSGDGMTLQQLWFGLWPQRAIAPTGSSS